MQRHRIFIAINLPEEIKKRLIEYQSKWPELPVRWMKPENLHITLAFLGYLSDEELLEVLKITKEVAQRNKSFSINLNKIFYGPPKKMPYSETKSLTGRRDKVENRPPRMIWAAGEKSAELGKLQKDLENLLLSPVVFFPAKASVEAGKKEDKNENRHYVPHITVGRIRQWEFRAIEPEERPIVDENISLSFEVNSIEVMESQLKRGGAEYTILESAPLADSKNF